jgi:hypothetical protein
MRLRRVVWRVVARSLASLVAAWIIFHKLEQSTDLNLPFSLEEPLERGIAFLALCAAILLVIELASRLMSRILQ